MATRGHLATLDVETFRQEYLSGMSTRELARQYGVSRPAIKAARRRHGIPLRARAQWHRHGAARHTGKGNAAGYSALHTRVHRLLGLPQCGADCGTPAPEKKYDWANLTGDFADPADYRRLCRRCHARFDGQLRLTEGAIHAIRNGIAAGVPLRLLGRQLGVSYGAVWKVAHGKTWKDVA